ncbi:formylglycine-generating enzyme family protein [Sinisalibacter aestuarii]|uniref:Sulfatase-modifying factor enzyme-like domain-containing protein n=1 Tax=Sinisalibacter aestuarii TaxID=2949426 RepID=A0ABQ5LPE1_9RHOB|nr:formylglycine-generating enzyme family protein [Sinisalibacter aestuarii]GKY86828.1 hypothetical protein STA1M1_06970 [Sinisalibacter aestuarii]
MRKIEGGTFSMGSDAHYPEEGPVREVEVVSFLIDEAPVTNREFAEFVRATGHVTFCEIPPDPADYPGLLPEMAKAGSLVFHKMPFPRRLREGEWWEMVLGAAWNRPLGPGSGIDDLLDHPVVHITYADARAYAEWVGKRLPTEAEWEFAARGGLDGKEFAWGDTLAPGGQMLANYWQGEFPYENTLQDGWERTSPVRSFPANGYGLFDMIGNVWEWTEDWFATSRPGAPRSACCGGDRRGKATEADSIDPAEADFAIGRKVLKGGSHLCAENYCRRYRPAARWPQPIDTSTSHVGFRCAKSLDA